MRQRTITLSLLLLLFFAASSIPQGTLAVSNTVVISEFRTRGPNGGNDEFIELSKLTGSPINISGWQIKGSNANGDVTTRATIINGVRLSPDCHYLLTNPNSTGGPYSGSVPGNQTFGPGITDDGGIALRDAAGTIMYRLLLLIIVLTIGAFASPQSTSSQIDVIHTPQYIVSVDDKKKNEQTVYITKIGAKFNLGSCHHLRRSKIAIKRSEAIAQGYEACKVCQP